MSRERRLRIAHCIDSFAIGGTELNAVRTIESLDQSRYELTVLHLHADGVLRARYEASGVRLIHFPIRSLRTFATVRQGLRLATLLRSLAVDVLHTHDLYTNIFAVPYARIGSQAQIVASRRWWYDSPRPGLGFANRLMNKLAHKVLANSASVARMLRDEEHVPQSKIIEIPNFLDDVAFADVDPREVSNQRMAWGLPENAFVIGIVARLAQVKNHALLIRALANLDDECHVVAIGAGPELVQLQKLAESLGVSHRLRFVGELVNSGNLHRSFDVAVLCSTSEGFPNSIIEALAAARPVVATNVGGVGDVLQDGVSGRLVPSGDAGLLAAAIRELKSNVSTRARLGTQGREIVRGRFHRTVVIKRLSDLYDSLGAQVCSNVSIGRS